MALRQAPGEKSPELQTLKTGERLTDLGDVSRFETEIRLLQTPSQSPWIKVQTTAGQTGWVLAALLESPESQPDWLFQKKLHCYFGSTIKERRNRLYQAPVAESAGGLAEQFREAAALRDTCLRLLDNRVEPGASDIRLEFDWLGQLLPGFLFQWAPDRVHPRLFADWRVWRQKADLTPEKEDDQFFDICILIFPADSVESLLPAWVFPIAEDQGYSNLGAGIHLRLLNRLEEALQRNTVFEPELKAFQGMILEDILDKNRAYWQPQSKILEEIRAISKMRFQSLNSQDRFALETRRRMFEDPEATGLKLNLRAGE